MGSIKEELRRLTEQTRPSIGMWRASVLRNVQLTPKLRRVTLGGDDLAGYPGWLPADAVKLFLPLPGEREAVPPGYDERGMLDTTAPRRAYTVRRFDRQAREADIDVVLHGDSVGSLWARTAEVGDGVVLTGPRRDFYPGDEVDWHLLAGDETALPAIAGILERMPAGTRVICHIEVGDASEQQELATEADLTLRWWHRDGMPPASSDLLLNAVTATEFPEGTGQGWVAAEAAAMRAIRRYLLSEGGLVRENLHAVAYWRQGLDQDELDRIATEQVQAELAKGRALADLDPEEFEPV